MPPAINVLNQVFGKLTAISDERVRGRTGSLCKCDCGTTVVVLNYWLVKGYATSCGCDGPRILPGRKAPDLIGKMFGDYTVIERLGSTGKGALWQVKCQCGALRKHTTTTLTKGRALRCSDCNNKNSGTFKKQPKIGEIHPSYWSSILYSARSRGLSFNLTLEFAWDLFLLQDRKCSLTGQVLTFSSTSGRGDPEQTASLDRIDSSKGYFPGNVQWVHKVINTMKLSLSDEEFINWCQKVVNNQKKI